MAASDNAFRDSVASIIRHGQAIGDISTDVADSAFAAMLLGQLRGVALQFLIDPDHINLDHAKTAIDMMVRNVLRST